MPTYAYKNGIQIELTQEQVDDFAVAQNQVDDTSAKIERNMMLAASDWTVLPDSPLSESKQQEWKTYRQSLRDISDQEGYPENINWPVEPE